MKLIVGLGNPGAKYEGSRHNVGFRVIDRMVARFRCAEEVHEKQALTRSCRIAGGKIVLAKPLTFMNLSGEAVGGLVRKYLEGDLGDMIVVYDDVDLPLGTLRIRRDGSSGTHNGMRSIADSLGTEAFPRLRVGVRGEGYSEASDLADYVLKNFEKGENQIIQETIERATDALLLCARGDLTRAMNQFNRNQEKGETVA